MATTARTEIIARVVALAGELIAAHRPDLVVIACNTASTLVMPHLRAQYTVPFVGTVPAIKPACAQSVTKRVSVLGTKGTVKREYTSALIRDFAKAAKSTLVGSARLAAFAEAELHGTPVADQLIAEELTPCFVDGGGRRTDTIVLACTHYPLLLDRLARLAPWPVDLIDPGAGDRPASDRFDWPRRQWRDAGPGANRFHLWPPALGRARGGAQAFPDRRLSRRRNGKRG